MPASTTTVLSKFIAPALVLSLGDVALSGGVPEHQENCLVWLGTLVTCLPFSSLISEVKKTAMPRGF